MIRLGDLLKNLQTSVFTGQGFGRYYPVGSNSAYYRMIYTPDQMTVLHKSPSSPVEEKVVVDYEYKPLMEIGAVSFFIGQECIKTVSDFKDEEDGGLSILVKYLFLDPRIVLRCAEDVSRLPDNEAQECYTVTVLSDPIIETKVVCEFCVVNDRELSKMRVRKFLLGKEIYPQNMDITFSMPI